jgi:hypothetical protein
VALQAGAVARHGKEKVPAVIKLCGIVTFQHICSHFMQLNYFMSLYLEI